MLLFRPSFTVFGFTQTAMRNATRLGSVQDDFRFVQTQVEELDEIVDSGLCQRVDVVDAVFGKGFSLLSRDAFDCGKRHCFAGSNERTHLFGDFALDLFFAADVDVPTDQLGRESNVLTALADRQRELIFVDDDFHLAVFDVGDSDLD